MAMKRISTVLALALAATAAAVPARAVTCALDDVPAATLLLPYFEVDAGNPNGRTTLFSIDNISSSAQLAHVVLWTDLGIPTLRFDVYLTGYDVQTINLRDVLNGTLPQTADAAEDPDDRTSPKGEFSQDTTFPGCAGALPPAPLSAAAVQSLLRAHTGQSLPEEPGSCSGTAIGDGIARGYVTVDVATRCSTLSPGDSGYFGAGGVASDANVLWGDFFYVAPGDTAVAQAQNLVRLESDPSVVVPDLSFYTPYAPRASGHPDYREPLPTVWAVRYLDGGGFHGTTDLIVWRDAVYPNAAFPCNAPLHPLYSGARRLVAFDEEENASVVDCPAGCTFLPPAGATSRIHIGGSAFPIPYEFGWLFLDLHWPNLATTLPVLTFSPAWVGTVTTSQGLFSVGLPGTPLDNGCDPASIDIDPGIVTLDRGRTAGERR